MTQAIAPLKPTFIDPEEWIHISEASPLLGMHDGHLRRLCGGLMGEQDNARQMSPIDGGKPTWFIRRKFDVRLHPSKTFAERNQIPHGQIDALTEKVRQGMYDRLACITAFREACNTWKGFQKDWLPHLIGTLRDRFPGIRISRTRLLDWDKNYKVPADVLKLADSRGGNTRGKADPACWDMFRKLFLGSHRSAQSVWGEVNAWAKEQGFHWAPYSRVTKDLKKRIPEAEQAKYRDPDAYKMHFAPYLTQNPDRFQVNECWVGDNTPLDLWCRFEGRIIRPGLTIWLDWRSRRICGWALAESPNSSTICGAFRMGMMDPVNRGGPSQVTIDNGKDFDAWMFHGQTKKERLSKQQVDLGSAAQGIFTLLGVGVHHTLAYEPQGKARCERWFRTLHGDFDKTFATFAGNEPGNCPESTYDILKNHPHKIPSFEHVQARLADYIAGYNQNADHQRDDMTGESPDGLYAQLTTGRVMADPASLDLLLQKWQRPTTVGRNGISVAPVGLRLAYGYMTPELMPYKASSAATRPQVFISYDPHDVRTIRVFDSSWSFICDAPLNDTMGLPTDEPIEENTLRRVQAGKKRYSKAEKVITEGQHREYMTNYERVLDQKEIDKQAQTPPPPAPGNMRLVTTHLDGNGKEVRRQHVKRVMTGTDAGSMPVAPGETKRGLVSPLGLNNNNSNRARRPVDEQEEWGLASPLGMATKPASGETPDDERPALSWATLAALRQGENRV